MAFRPATPPEPEARLFAGISPQLTPDLLEGWKRYAGVVPRSVAQPMGEAIASIDALVPHGVVGDSCDVDLAGGNSNTNRQLIPMAPKGFLTPDPLPYRFEEGYPPTEGMALDTYDPTIGRYNRALHAIMEQRLGPLFLEGGGSSFADLSLVAVEPIPEEILVSASPFAPTVPSSFHEHSHQSE